MIKSWKKYLAKRGFFEQEAISSREGDGGLRKNGTALVFVKTLKARNSSHTHKPIFYPLIYRVTYQNLTKV